MTFAPDNKGFRLLASSDDDLYAGSQPASPALGEFCAFLAVVVGCALLLVSLPLGGAIAFSGDEGLELGKALLWSRGYPLYDRVWSDQPPMWTAILGFLFYCYGPSVLAARLVVVCFALLLFGSFFALVAKRSCVWSGAVATLLLLASPAVLQLSVSAMQEVPAFAAGLASVWLLWRWMVVHRAYLLVASGMLMGVALAIKLTVFLLWPAILVQIVLASRPSPVGILRSAARAACIWASTAFGALAVFCLTLGWPHWSSMIGTHLGTGDVPGLPRPEQYGFLWPMVGHHPETVAAALVTVVVLLFRRGLGQIAFPLMMLLTVSGVHAVHRPVWDFYYLHLAIPLAWLAGMSVEAVLQTATQWAESRTAYFVAARRSVWLPFGLGILGLLFVPAAPRLEAAFTDLQNRPRRQDSAVLKLMQNHSSATRWAFSYPAVFAFHACALMPPELAVVSLKRFWAGQITKEELVSTLKRYQPDQVLVPRGFLNEEWRTYADTRYSIVYDDGVQVLYMLKEEGTQ